MIEFFMRTRRPIASCLVAAAAGALAPFVAVAGSDEQAFDTAKHYTVKVRTQVELPFYGDKKGTFTGAGFVVDAARGWIMTNAHVAARSPSTVRVAFLGGEYHAAKKLYVDPYIDLALLEIAPGNFPRPFEAAELDCESSPAIGHAVGAFGHPWDLSFTGTRGIISGVTAKFAGMLEMLQTDAPINPGNSGGPLISLRTGRVVGINTAIRRGSQNTNFAVPMSHACRVLELLQAGKDPSPPKLPMAFFRDLDETNRLTVARVYAEDNVFGLREGDVIREIEGQHTVENRGQLIHLLRGHLDGTSLRISRGETEIVVRGRLEPAESMIQRRGVYVSGILFGVMPWRDLGDLVNSRLGLMVHYVERGSIGDAQRVDTMDMLVSIDGKGVTDVDDLHRRLERAADKGRTVTLKFIRVGDVEDSLFQYIERPLPIADLRFVGGS